MQGIHYTLTKGSMFSQFKTVAVHSKLITTAGKTSYQVSGIEVPGHLRPLADEKQNIGNESFANLYAFTFSSEYDMIKEGEKLEIDGDMYSIKGVNKHAGIRISYIRAIIIKERP